MRSGLIHPPRASSLMSPSKLSIGEAIAFDKPSDMRLGLMQRSEGYGKVGYGRVGRAKAIEPEEFSV